jgi:hypothetical protein
MMFGLGMQKFLNIEQKTKQNKLPSFIERDGWSKSKHCCCPGCFLANIFNDPPPVQIGMNNLQHAKWPILREAA